MRTFEAQYWGECPSCHEKITPGQQVHYDRNSAVVHDDCEQPMLDLRPQVPERPVVVCDRCWLVKPCDCGGDA